MLSFFSGVLLLFHLLSLDLLRLRSRDGLRLDLIGEKLLLSRLSLDRLLDLLSRESPLLLVFNAQAFKSEGIPPSLVSVLGLLSLSSSYKGFNLRETTRLVVERDNPGICRLNFGLLLTQYDSGFFDNVLLEHVGLPNVLPLAAHLDCAEQVEGVILSHFYFVSLFIRGWWLGGWGGVVAHESLKTAQSPNSLGLGLGLGLVNI